MACLLSFVAVTLLLVDASYCNLFAPLTRRTLATRTSSDPLSGRDEHQVTFTSQELRTLSALGCSHAKILVVYCGYDIFDS